jgi:hypothetical protein
MMTDTSNHIRVELKKKLHNSRDLDGQDVEWSIGNSYSITAIWDSNGLGSSGGSASHSLMRALNYQTIPIDTNSIAKTQQLSN